MDSNDETRSALAAYESALRALAVAESRPPTTDDRRLTTAGAVVAARAWLFRALIADGWNPPAWVRPHLAADETLVREADDRRHRAVLAALDGHADRPASVRVLPPDKDAPAEEPPWPGVERA